MRIHNIRLGLATNSSSTHSLVFLGNTRGVHDDEVEEGEFGWNFFTAASSDAKMRYLGVVIRDNLRYVLDETMSNIVAESLVGTKLPSDGYVDHQSMWCLPKAWDKVGLDIGFIEDLKQFLLQEKLAILGGNDNTEDEHPLASQGERVRLGIKEDYGAAPFVCRKDGVYWTLFNRDSGAKIRMSFDQQAPPYEKAFAPELVDIKITDYCPFDCKFCYQGSTKEGQHADMPFLYSVARALKHLRVFEVAIGGGEPTMHPQFEDILRNFRSYGVVPNFTTKSLHWMRDQRRAKEILGLAGDFAYSVQRREEAEEFAAHLKLLDSSRGSIQCVLGVVDDYSLKSILELAKVTHLRVTLLGYKTTGRGAKHQPIKNPDWIRIVKKSGANVGVDTAIIAEYGKQLRAAGVPDQMMTPFEGKFSAYIDAVEKKMGPSSYCESLQMHKIKNQYDMSTELVERFSKW